MEKKNKVILALIVCGIVIASVFLSGCIGGGDENKKPSIDAGLEQTVNIGDTVQFTGTASDSDGSISKYEWDFDGDGTYDWSSTTSGSTTHIYTNVGTYSAKFKVTDNDNAVVTDICLITVVSSTNQPPTANAGNDQTVDVGDTVSFVGTGSDIDGTVVKYEWDFDGDGTYDWTSSVTGSTTHIYDSAGTYNAKLRVTDNNNAIVTDICVVTVVLSTNQPPTANAGNDQTANVDDTVSFVGTGSDIDGTVVKYEWDFDGDGTYDWSSSVTGSTTHIYDSAGTFTAIFRVTDDEGATATDSCTVTVTQLKTWHYVTTISGVGDKTTDTFTCPGKWRISWTTTYDNEDFALFYGFAYPEGETAIYVASFSGLSGETYVHETGTFYLKIITANLNSWEITIESYY